MCAARVDLSRYYFQVSLKLYPKGGSAPGQPLPTAPMARGLLFTMLNHIDAGLVEQLHAPNAIRPYAIQRFEEWDDAGTSRSRGPGRNRREDWARPFRSVTFTINIFREDILRAFQKYLIQLQDIAVPLGEHQYLAGEVGIGRKSFLDLFPPRLLAGNSAAPDLPASTPSSYRVAFVTPTYFSTTRSPYPLRLPTPDALAGNLARTWNAFHIGAAEVDITPFVDWVNRGVIATSFALRTRKWYVGKPQAVAGVVGWATYAIREPNPQHEIWLQALLRLGELTNVGRSRTAGAGQIRVEAFLGKKNT